MKNIAKIALLSIALFTLSSCAITNSYGPYMGKVVDKENDAPIEGAVVFLRFYTEAIGPVSEFADAVETLTDAKGEFFIPSHRIFVFRPLSVWMSDWYPIVFKPGYGAFPGHIETLIVDSEGSYIPENKHVTIKLPKLKTREERRDNLSNLSPGSAPPEAYRTLRKLEKIERKETGLDP